MERPLTSILSPAGVRKTCRKKRQNFKYLWLLLVLLFTCLCWSQCLWAFESYKLDNGLEVFLQADHSVPLVDIRITFRAGAIVETAELNGLCHLYEHMLFKGNALYSSQEDFKAALKRMGVGSWNGGTSTEYVTYYITIPSDRLAQGLEFWAAAVQTPLLKEEELATEREVVHNEIAGDQSEPEYALHRAALQALYPDYWYRRDVGGDLATIDNATVAKLQFIKNNFYVPNNAAVFVSGDIDARRVMAAVKKYYGAWQRGPAFPDLPPHKPLPRDKWVVVDTSPTRGLASVSFTFRGPDTGIDAASTYGADVWGQMINDPEGRFKNAVFKAVPELHGGTRHISAGYATQRDGGTSSFSFTVTVPEKPGLAEIITRLRTAVTAEIAAMTGPDYFAPAALAAAKQELENYDILSRETAAGYMANLSFWWASTSTDYYQNYLDNIRRVTLANVQAYVRTYLQQRFLASVWINKDDEQRHRLSRHFAERDK